MKNNSKLLHTAYVTIAVLRKENEDLKRKVYLLTDERNKLKGETLNLTASFNRRLDADKARLKSIAETKQSYQQKGR